MSKKNKKNREFDRLQNLYQPTSDISSTTEAVETLENNSGIEKVAETNTEEASEFLSSTKYAAKHLTVKRDLAFLSILIVIMTALLFGINYLAATTNLGDWITNLFSGIF